MKLTCFGSRGSLPSPSIEREKFYTKEFGGNTTCYFVEAGPFNIMLDLGSGGRVLGNHLVKEKKIGKNFILLFSHYHWDHIQGIGFHVPLYIGSNTFHIHGFAPDNSRQTSYLVNVVEAALSTQQERPFFPIPHHSLPAKKKYYVHNQLFSETVFYSAEKSEDYEIVKEVRGLLINPNVIKITTIPLNHPNGCLGYRIDYLGSSLAFCTDNEPFHYLNHQINTLCKDVDFMILDGQYTEEQLKTNKQSFGHGSPKFCLEQAINCNAKNLIISHHDPENDDHFLENMENEIKNDFLNRKKNSNIKLEKLEFAKEGNFWEI
jgi:phosphoribosyl 1,2-cyclic phosphodiesterase